jgi:hypothetical protein
MKIDPNKHQHAIFCHSECGPSFVGGITIKNNANTTMDSYSNLGFIYKHPQYGHGTNEASTFLDRMNFNWMKLKSIKENEKEREKFKYKFLIENILF